MHARLFFRVILSHESNPFLAEILQINLRTGINVRVFPALLQDRREVLTATSTSGNPNAGRGSDLAIFPGIWTHSFCRLLLKMTSNVSR